MFSQNQAQSEIQQGDNRRREIISATIALIAQKGMEGLRIRDIAETVGINNATLHYYFKTKEMLIEGVVNTIVHELVSTRSPGATQPTNPREELEAHLSDILYQIRHTPQRFVVLGELLMRSHHEQAVHAILKSTDKAWHSFLVDIIKRGVSTGDFNKDIDASSVGHLIMMLLKGSTLQLDASPDEIEAVIAQVNQLM
ncbi:MAG: TetR/AcrR family transcriptional regulator [Chloroflexota bacterium]|nr:TetR/AcrR family transcriptional regulator [Chloroflexota bacterium]